MDQYILSWFCNVYQNCHISIELKLLQVNIKNDIIMHGNNVFRKTNVPPDFSPWCSGAWC